MPLREGISPAEQASWLRFPHAAELGEKVILVSDLDMLPLSRWYFVDQLKSVSDDAYVHLNPCRPEEYRYRFPSCYHVAKGRKYREFLFEGQVPEDTFSVLPHLNWCAEEEYVTRKLVKRERRGEMTLLRRGGGVNGHRVDRISNWKSYDPKLHWYDAHCPRPFQQFQEEIKRVASLAR